MGKTVASYRMALEGEISRWNGFVRALRKDDCARGFLKFSKEEFSELKRLVGKGVSFFGMVFSKCPLTRCLWISMAR